MGVSACGFALLGACGDPEGGIKAGFALEDVAGAPACQGQLFRKREGRAECLARGKACFFCGNGFVERHAHRQRSAFTVDKDFRTQDPVLLQGLCKDVLA